MGKFKNVALSFASLSLYWAVYVVYVFRYNPCGGDTCDSVSGACLTVCVPTGIKYYVPIMLVLIVIALGTTVAVYRNLRDKRAIVYLITAILISSFSVYTRESNLVLKVQNQKYVSSRSYDCGDSRLSTFSDRMYEGCLLEVFVKEPYISGDELAAIVEPMGGSVTDADDAYAYGLYQVGFSYGQVDGAERVLREHPSIEAVRRYTGVVAN